MFTQKHLCIMMILVFWISIPVLGASKERDEFGLGLTLGEPSRIHGQFFWSKRSALEITAAWSFHDWFMTAADFQIYDYILDSPQEWRWYYGGGAYLALPENEDGTLGIRVPIGIRYRFPHSAIDVWAEVDPALQLAPETEPEFQGGFGVTFWIR